MAAKYDIDVSPMDGNAYSILGSVREELKKIGVPDNLICDYFNEATSGDYDNLLKVSSDWVNLKLDLKDAL